MSRFQIQLQPASHSPTVWAYEIYLVSDWDAMEEQPAADAQIENLAQTDRLHVAMVLLDSWQHLAERHYWPGYVLCVNDRGERVGDLKATPRRLPPRQGG